VGDARIFTIVRDSSRSPADAWERITDWPQHARHVPFTRIEVVTEPPTRPGTVFVARTGRGRLAFDDPMEVVSWTPPAAGRNGRCRLEKRGRVMLGWAELTVTAHGPGSRVTWRESSAPARLPAVADPLARLAGRLLFGRVLRRLLDG
jgi:Polyketide cyclase / dehydrase and lipid transport